MPPPKSTDNDRGYDVVIVGAGIAGMACGVALARRGVRRIRIVEKARALRPVGAAIGLFPNGLEALRLISPRVHDRVVASAIPNESYQMKDLDGTLIRDTDMSKSSMVAPTYLVWYLLQQYLAEELPEGALILGSSFESYRIADDDRMKVRVSTRNGGDTTETEYTCRVLLGADGINSMVRSQIFGERDLVYHGKMMFRAVLDLATCSIDEGVCPPTGTSVGYQGDEKGKLFSFRETAEGILTFTAMSVFDKPELLAGEGARMARLKQIFEEYPSDVQHILDCTQPSALYENAVYDIEVEDAWSKGAVLLLGDAAHAMTPGLGQGANQGLEDACELAGALAPVLLSGDSHEGGTANSVTTALELFWRCRIERLKKVHAASRSRTASVNRWSKERPLNIQKDSDVSFLDDLYGWKPSASLPV
mmetsp:Transcript_23214/g.68625  ORF Transcript_23214/g.68625 Transcript_23214/m.68625 type:complete len:421 (-) Transcript_23214:369-1631(-)|eukprot:CAMPEP_0113563470 /NCGR_PEP_ID=MMETSP0015_2-20120614/21090_1 /TAXON_ID=2838 /ORGANISM="Odontella" /LENGTH=420 /DNA_ID=CAMNT_0000465461 /DNA_START=153 /DNA_END=1415 /DNA_ORIENTATION=- /assembly_acc=CAM_ASM_000160